MSVYGAKGYKHPVQGHHIIPTINNPEKRRPSKKIARKGENAGH